MSEGKTPPGSDSSGSTDARDLQRVRERSAAPMSAGGLEMRIDAALGEWPMLERSAIDWDEAADRIVGRIENGDRGRTADYVSDEDLFAAPLATSTEESQNSAAPIIAGAKAAGAEGSKMGVQSERRERRSFQGLAEMARGSTPPPSVQSGVHRTSVGDSFAPSAPVDIIENKQKGDSGILDLNTLAAEDPGAAQRAQSTPLATSGLFDEDVAAAAAAAQAPSIAPSVPVAVQAQPAKAEKKGGGGVVVLFGTVVAVAAIAAGTFFVIRTNKSSDATATKLAAAPTATVTNAQPMNAQRPTTAPVATTTDNAIDPTALPLANAPAATAPLAPTGLLPFAPRPDPNATATTTAMASAAPAVTATAAPTEVASAAAPAPTSSASLEEQMRQAAGPSTSAAPTPAPGAADTTTPANIPMKPSQGAVSGALSAALPGARQCLGPDDPISQASVTFQSNGSVVSVSVTGGAAGKPQEACIKQALMRAKIAPFAQATFIGYVTIRPN